MVSDYRHVAIGLARKIKGIVIRRAEIEMGEGAGDDDIDGVGGEERDGKKWEYIWDAQATHGSMIAAGHYAVDMRFPNQLQPEKIAHFREISRLWHRFLERGGHELVKVEGQEQSRKRKRDIKPQQEDAEEVKSVKLKRVKLSLSQPVTVQDLQRGLEQFVGAAGDVEDSRARRGDGGDHELDATATADGGAADRSRQECLVYAAGAVGGDGHKHCGGAVCRADG